MEDKNIQEWRFALAVFKKIIEGNPPSEKVKEKLLALAKSASNNTELNYRQREAIVARCDNYINGTYGGTKRPEHLAYGNPTPPITKEQSNNK